MISQQQVGQQRQPTNGKTRQGQDKVENNELNDDLEQINGFFTCHYPIGVSLISSGFFSHC